MKTELLKTEMKKSQLLSNPIQPNTANNTTAAKVKSQRFRNWCKKSRRTWLVWRKKEEKETGREGFIKVFWSRVMERGGVRRCCGDGKRVWRPKQGGLEDKAGGFGFQAREVGLKVGILTAISTIQC